MAIVPIRNLGGGETKSKTTYLIQNGKFVNGFSLSSMQNNFGGTQGSTYYDFIRQSGSGLSVGKSSVKYKVSKIHIEGYSASAGYNGVGLDENSLTSVSASNEFDYFIELPTSNAVKDKDVTSNSYYIFVYNYGGGYHGYIKNLWIES